MKINEWFSPAKTSSIPSTYKFSPRGKILTLWLLAGVGILMLFFSAHFLSVFIWAAVAAYLFNPLVNFISERAKISKAVAILLLYVVISVLIYWAAKSVFPLITYEISEFSKGSVEQSSSIIGRVASQGSFTAFDITIDLKDFASKTVLWITSLLRSQAFPIFFGVIERVVFTLIFFVVMFYFLLQGDSYRLGFEKMIPAPYRDEISNLVEKINSTLGAYIRAQVLLIAIMSTASYIVLWTLKVKFSLVLSIATGILEVIPVFGPICATIVVATVALFQSTAPYGLSNPTLALIVIIAYFVLRQLEDYLIIPNVAAKFVRVHPVLGIFSLLLGGSIGGVLGLFLAIPTAAVVKVIAGYLYHKIVE